MADCAYACPLYPNMLQVLKPGMLIQRIFVSGEVCSWPAHVGNIHQVDGFRLGHTQAALKSY